MRVIYIGVRISKKDALLNLFLHGKKEIAFSKSGYHQIGGTYDLIKTKDKKSWSFPRLGLPKSKTQKEVDKKQIKAWEKESELEIQEHKVTRERKRIKNKSDWLAVLEPIRAEHQNASFERQLAIEICVLREIKRIEFKIR